MTGKLTKAQIAGLKSLDTWRRSHWVSTSAMNADGIGTGTLRSLEASGCINVYKDGKTTYWQMNDAGRSALAQVKP